MAGTAARREAPAAATEVIAAVPKAVTVAEAAAACIRGPVVAPVARAESANVR